MVSAFSIPQSKRDQKILQNPGPGQYNPENSPKLTNPKTPQYSIGKQRRLSLGENGVPGPGSYNSHEIKTHVEHPPSYSFRMKTKLPEERLDLGPGSYMPKYDFSNSRVQAYSFKARSHSVLDSQVPGPGNYQPFKSSVVLDHVSKFAHQKRDLSKSELVPGPGTYEYTQAFNRYAMRNQPKYQFGSRLNEPRGLEVPGPGTYEDKKKVYSRIGGIMSRDIRFSMEHTLPLGPGQYNPADQKVKQKNPSFSLSKSNRGIQQLKDQYHVPGPGQYNSPESFSKFIQKTPNYRFSRDKKLKLEVNQVPGPGQYNSKDDINTKHSYIPQKSKQHSDPNVPGPGAYEVKEELVKKTIKYSLPKDKRDTKFDNEVPGPGSYQPKSPREQPLYGFGSDKKLQTKVPDVPGPGHYNLKPHFADVPKYLIPDKK